MNQVQHLALGLVFSVMEDSSYAQISATQITQLLIFEASSDGLLHLTAAGKKRKSSQRGTQEYNEEQNRRLWGGCSCSLFTDLDAIFYKTRDWKSTKGNLGKDGKGTGLSMAGKPCPSGSAKLL